MSLAPGTIVVVDDDAVVLRTLVRILTRAGHEVLPCGSYEEVEARLAQATKPDLVITDVVLDGSTGHRVANLVRRLSPCTRLVFISGYGNVAVPGHLVLDKPFTPNELVNLVDQVLSASTSADAHAREAAFSASRKKH